MQVNGRMKRNNDMYCSNCGGDGHVYRNCHDAVNSYGIILVHLPIADELRNKFIEKFNGEKKDQVVKDMHGIVCDNANALPIFCEIKDDMKFLIIQRKHTLGFIEFVRGKYNIGNVSGITFLFEQMIPSEIERIRVSSFEELWNFTWGDRDGSLMYVNDFVQSKLKFNKLKQGGEYLKLDFYTSHVLSKWKFPEWGFPKGRRNFKESNRACAIREFKEESGFTDSDFVILEDIDPFLEEFIGTNGIKYRHVYYVALTMNDKIPYIDKNNNNQKNEIGDIGFYSFEDILGLFRPYHDDRRKILEQVYMLLVNNVIDCVSQSSKLVANSDCPITSIQN